MATFTLRARLLVLNLSQRGLSRKYGIPQSSISRVFSGEFDRSSVTTQRVAAAVADAIGRDASDVLDEISPTEVL